MTTEMIGRTRSAEAAADLSTKQNYIVKLDSTGKAALADSGTAAIVGVLQNYPASGEQATYAFTGTAKVVAGGSITPGAWVTSDGNGKAVATTTDKNVVLGRYVGTSTASSGDLVEIELGIFTLSA